MPSGTSRCTVVAAAAHSRQLQRRPRSAVRSQLSPNEFSFGCLFGEWDLPGPVPGRLRAEALLAPPPFTFDAERLVALERHLEARSPLNINSKRKPECCQ
jgi:hypothetical protein